MAELSVIPTVMEATVSYIKKEGENLNLSSLLKSAHWQFVKREILLLKEFIIKDDCEKIVKI